MRLLNHVDGQVAHELIALKDPGRILSAFVVRRKLGHLATVLADNIEVVVHQCETDTKGFFPSHGPPATVSASSICSPNGRDHLSG
jgi:hypothetical protein